MPWPTRLIQTRMNCCHHPAIRFFEFYPSMANIVPVADQEVNATIRAGQYSLTITEANYALIGYNLKFSYTLLDHPDILQPV